MGIMPGNLLILVSLIATINAGWLGGLVREAGSGEFAGKTLFTFTNSDGEKNVVAACSKAHTKCVLLPKTADEKEQARLTKVGLAHWVDGAVFGVSPAKGGDVFYWEMVLPAKGAPYLPLDDDSDNAAFRSAMAHCDLDHYFLYMHQQGQMKRKIQGMDGTCGLCSINAVFCAVQTPLFSHDELEAIEKSADDYVAPTAFSLKWVVKATVGGMWKRDTLMKAMAKYGVVYGGAQDITGAWLTDDTQRGQLAEYLERTSTHVNFFGYLFAADGHIFAVKNEHSVWYNLDSVPPSGFGGAEHIGKKLTFEGAPGMAMKVLLKDLGTAHYGPKMRSIIFLQRACAAPKTDMVPPSWNTWNEWKHWAPRRLAPYAWSPQSWVPPRVFDPTLGLEWGLLLLLVLLIGVLCCVVMVAAAVCGAAVHKGMSSHAYRSLLYPKRDDMADVLYSA